MTGRFTKDAVRVAVLAATGMYFMGAGQAGAQNRVTIDASTQPESPRPVLAKLGSAKSPSGRTIGVNSQYLTLDGKPWLPVMGEFHYSRYPEREWEQEILKMKAGGVEIVSTYIIWIHHEQTEGVFDWKGQRDLRKFVELCAKHGLYVYPRIGPWAHAEARNGGLPDWVLKNSAVRQNDPVYLKEVQTLFGEISGQLKGLLWKDGGPVIGLQVENEYRDRGPGKGDEHIRTLKNMAIADGLDVPLYTVTGWDGTSIPLDAVLPVFGGYPDAPWDGSSKKLPANEVYAFRFDNRSAGNMGAIGGRGQSGSSTYQGTPFLTAEVGSGIQDTYFRRPVVSADDIAAIVPVMLGSGVNMLGYYMFHGGRNPDGGRITLQESQATGYPTDVPVKSYDFQAPLSEFGQERESFRKLKLLDYFLNDFGPTLAPMAAHAPAKVPTDPSDASVPRVSARTLGDSGFIFFTNHVRGLPMPERRGFQIELKLPSGTVRVPETPISLASDAYGIWPVNLRVPGGGTLLYSTGQIFKRVQSGDQTWFFFFAIPGVRPEFAFSAETAIGETMGSVETQQTPAARRLLMNADLTAEVHLPGGVHLVMLPEKTAEQVWRVDQPSMLLASAADTFSNGDTWTLQSTGQNVIDLGVFGARAQAASPAARIKPLADDGPFFRYRATFPVVDLEPVLTRVRPASERAPTRFGQGFSWRPNPLPLAPSDEDFLGAAAWKLDVPALPKSGTLSDAFLTISYEGDAARLKEGVQLVDDNFWNGVPWSIGLREIDAPSSTPKRSFELEILPLPKSFSGYLEQGGSVQDAASGQSLSLTGVRLIPQYQLTMHPIPQR